MAAQSSVTLEALAAYPFILVDLPVSREFLMVPFWQKGLAPRILLRTRSVDMVRSMVAQSDAVSLLFTPAMRRSDPKAGDRGIAATAGGGADRTRPIGDWRWDGLAPGRTAVARRPDPRDLAVAQSGASFAISGGPERPAQLGGTLGPESDAAPTARPEGPGEGCAHQARGVRICHRPHPRSGGGARKAASASISAD
ncbi:MAG: hypothetical protein IPF96_15065 [Rhodobacter sp.]|nr:hypothetical protein [Rhodobacter sp.]